jgi:RNA polymerase sigma-70 factor (ECF subfamily)
MRASAADASVADHTTAESDDLVRLVHAAQRREPAALAELYRLFARMLHGILLSRVPAREVDDLLQDVFIQAMEHIGELREPRSFGAWIASIARHKTIDYFRRTPETTELPPELPSKDPDLIEAMSVLAAIQSLPDAYRETLTLRLVEGMTGPEIAARTGLTEGSVRVNLHRGMKQLRDKLQRSTP